MCMRVIISPMRIDVLLIYMAMETMVPTRSSHLAFHPGSKFMPFIRITNNEIILFGC